MALDHLHLLPVTCCGDVGRVGRVWLDGPRSDNAALARALERHGFTDWTCTVAMPAFGMRRLGVLTKPGLDLLACAFDVADGLVEPGDDQAVLAAAAWLCGLDADARFRIFGHYFPDHIYRVDAAPAH